VMNTSYHEKCKALTDIPKRRPPMLTFVNNNSSKTKTDLTFSRLYDLVPAHY